jgi:branched-chain amino acid transport system substrate-binding protein
VALAVSDLANQRRRLFLATEPLTDALTMANGNRFTFRIRPSTFMQTRMLVEAARGRTARRWAIVAPNYEYGSPPPRLQAPAARRHPGRRDRGRAVSRARPRRCRRHGRRARQARPDAIFNVLFGADLNPFVREGNTRGLFERRLVSPS